MSGKNITKQLKAIQKMTLLRSGVKLDSMKKLSLYIFLVLTFINSNSFASILINNCQLIQKDGKLREFEEGARHEYFINFKDGYVLFTSVVSDEFAKFMETLEELPTEQGGDITIIKEKVSNKKYIITFADKKLVTAKTLNDADIRGNLITYDKKDGSVKIDEDVSYAYYEEIIIKLDKNTVEHSYYADTPGGKHAVLVKEKHLGKHYIYQCLEDQSETANGTSSGTAFFINNRGNLITNNHVVEGCKLPKINYFNKEYETNLISTDKTLDLALLKVDLEPKSFISFSKKEPKKRQLVIVAGYPLGEYLSDDLKINEGKISSLKGFENNSNEITVDLAINPGNSGGPIVDENGQLVAVAVAGMSKEVTEGISFGIKSSAVTNFLKTNKISPDIKLTSFSMNDEKVNQLLEESTVYIFCE